MSATPADISGIDTRTDLFRARRNRHRRALVLLVLFLAGAVLLGLLTGPAHVPLSALGDVLLGRTGTPEAHILIYLRLPRVALALVVGAGLGVSGAVLQALLRNPLADPTLIGVSSGAAMGAAAFIVLGVAAAALPVAAFVGAIGALAIVYAVGSRAGGLDVARILLAGIAINAIAGAFLGLMSFIADDTALRTLTFWLLGSVAQAGWDSIGGAALLIGLGLPVMLVLGGPLNAYGLGEPTARSLGVPVQRLKQAAILAVALVVGAAVSVSGIISFIGLVVPHLLRLVGLTDHRVLLPASALGGGAGLIFADALAKTVVAPTDLPIGVLTGLVGGPFFLWLLVRKRGGVHR